MGIAVVTYVPWVPSLIHQIREVKAGYWIPAPTWSTAVSGAAEWISGFRDPASEESWVLLIFLISAIVIVACWKDRSGWYFVILAAVPWFLCFGIGTLVNRPIFQLRYMVFSQVALYGLVAVLLLRTSSFAIRGWIVTATVSMTIWSSVEYYSNLPTQPPAVLAVMSYVQRNYRPGDVVIASSQRTVNRLRYYASAAGIANVEVRCVVSYPQPEGHMVHFSSLTDNEVIWRNNWESYSPRRLWQVYDMNEEMPLLPHRMEQRAKREFTDTQGSHYVAILYAARHP